MFRRIAIAGLAALTLAVGVTPEVSAQQRVRSGGGNYRGNYSNYNHNNNNFNWGSFAAGAAVGAGVSRFGGGYGGYYGSGYYGSRYYGSPGYYSTPSYYTTPSYYSAAPATVIVPETSYTTVTTASPAPMPVNDNSALLNIRVPDGARVFFGNSEASGQGGSTRQFRSPPLQPGNDYQYELRAQWMQNGQVVDRARVVTVHAGDVVNVDFFAGN